MTIGMQTRTLAHTFMQNGHQCGAAPNSVTSKVILTYAMCMGKERHFTHLACGDLHDYIDMIWHVFRNKGYHSALALRQNEIGGTLQWLA